MAEYKMNAAPTTYDNAGATAHVTEYVGGEGSVTVKEFTSVRPSFEDFRRGSQYEGVIGTP